MITDSKLQAASKAFNIPVAAIKAVAEVESRGDGFMGNGKPVILFEPHIFYQQLQKRRIDPDKYLPVNSDILYPVWRKGAYGSYAQQHDRLERAARIDREAALMSASWGRFQIMGFNYTLCGCASLQEFVNHMYESEDQHLELFLNFLVSRKIDVHLRNLNWAKFAEGYNGKSYKQNSYDTKLQHAYLKYAK